MTAVQLDLFAQDEPAGPLDRLTAYWHEANRRWFGGELKPVPIVGGLDGTARTMGSWDGWNRRIKIRTVFLGQLDRPGMWKQATDVLLHEMVHQWISEQAPDAVGGEPHHGPTFTAHCNRIGAALGLGEVVSRKPRGKDVPLSRYWPHCLYKERTGSVIPPKFDPQMAAVCSWVRVHNPHSMVYAADFARVMKVSEVTIHRKLCVLERRGLLYRRDGRFYRAAEGGQ